MTLDLDLETLKLRTLILVNEVERRPGNSGKLDGLTKLAKLDFLCRYSDRAPAVALELNLVVESFAFDELEIRVPQKVPMVRYKFGPWDDRYYEVIGALVGRGLITFRRGKNGSVALATTAAGRKVCEAMLMEPIWAPVRKQCRAIAELFGEFSGNQLRGAIYRALPDAMNVAHRSVLK